MTEISLSLAARYASAEVPLVLWPLDTLPTIAPPPPSKPVWTTHEAWLSELPRLRGCFSEGEVDFDG